MFPSLGSPTGISPAFLKLFSSTGAFTAVAETAVLDAAGKEWARLPIAVSCSDNKLKLAIELDQIKSRDLPEFMVATLKQAGMGTIISLVLPEKKATYLIYPGFKCYLNLPVTGDEAKEAPASYRVDRNLLGEETLQGQRCKKNKVTIRSGATEVLEATTWEAVGLKGFPLKIEMRQAENRLVMNFQKLQFARTEGKQFEVPAGYAEYKDAQQMMFGIMKRIAGTGDSK